MSGERGARRLAAARRRRIAVGAASALAAIGIVAGVVTLAILLTSGPPAPAAEPAPPTTPAPTPALSTADALLADAAPDACAVSFTGDGISVEPVLQTERTLFAGLPIPTSEGRVFAGWYATPEAAAARDAAARVNGAEVVACEDRHLTLTGAWTTPDDGADVRVPILMYHQFTTNPEGESNALRLNYAYIGDFDDHMRHISESGFYLPTWDELGAFMDGELWLPERSLIVTDDDADSTWLELAVPVVEKYGVLTTSFVITKWRHEPTPGTYVLQRSHTDEMHEGGANGQGRMVNWTADEIAADLERSAEILGAKEVVAYPFGHYNDTTKAGVREAGYEFGRSIEPGTVGRDTDKLALPVIRIDYGATLDDLIARIG